MEQYINKLLLKLRVELAFFFLMTIVIAALGFYGVIPNGGVAAKDNAQTAYVINVVLIGSAFIITAAALKLFKLNTEQNIKRYTLDDAANVYHKWSLVRLALLFVVVNGGLIAFFVTLDDTGLFIAAVVMLLAAIFCFPSISKIKEYLAKSQQQ